MTASTIIRLFALLLLAAAAAFLFPWSLPGAGRALAVTEDEPLSGYGPVSVAQLEAELKLRNPGHIHPYISQLYVVWGNRYGIRYDLAFAQMLHETDSLRYGGLVQPWQNNFAGIGATGPGNPGRSYPSPEAGVIAHYDLLRYYIDVRGLGTPRALEGTWAVPGYGYGDAIARYATEMRNFSWNGYWKGSFNEIRSTPVDNASTSWYFPWYDSSRWGGMAGDWILIATAGAGAARVRLAIGDRVMRDAAHPEVDYWTIPEGGVIAPSVRNFTGGPVRVESLDGQPLIASQRVLYKDSFTETPGIPAESLADTWEFTWYDSVPQSGTVADWVLFANMGPVPAEVEVLVGGTRVAWYSAANGNALAPGAVAAPRFPGRIGGPVVVRSTNGQPLIASQRVLYKESFNEVMGVPEASLGAECHFPWYDSRRVNSMYGDWILVANAGTGPADVEIYIDGRLMADYRSADGDAIAAGGVVTPSFPDLTGGPVMVASTNGQPLACSQRVVMRDSLEESPGMTASSFAAESWFTWYDETAIDSMYGDWLLVENRGLEEARVVIYIGSVKMSDPGQPANDFFTIAPGERIATRFSGRRGGPVRIVSTNGQPLMASQRVLYRYGIAACGAAGC